MNQPCSPNMCAGYMHAQEADLGREIDVSRRPVERAAGRGGVIGAATGSRRLVNKRRRCCRHFDAVYVNYRTVCAVWTRTPYHNLASNGMS